MSTIFERLVSEKKEERYAALDELEISDKVDLDKKQAEVLVEMLTESNAGIRSQVSSILARVSTLGSGPIRRAFSKETHPGVKSTMFRSILEMEGVPFHIALEAVQTAKSNREELDDKYLEETIAQYKV